MPARDDVTINIITETKQAIQNMAGFTAAIGAAYLAVNKIISSTRELIDKWKIQEQAQATLVSAIKSTGKESTISAQAIFDLSASLQKVTTYGDEATISAAAMLQSLGDLDQKGLTKLIPLVQDFATGMHVDLNTAASLVGKTVGSTTNALSRYGIAIDATADKQTKITQLAEVMQQKFGGMAHAIASTDTGAIQQFQNALGDLEEQGGRLLAHTAAPFIKWLDDVVAHAAKSAESVQNLNDQIVAAKSPDFGNKSLIEQKGILDELVNKTKEMYDRGNLAFAYWAIQNAQLHAMDVNVTKLVADQQEQINKEEIMIVKQDYRKKQTELQTAAQQKQTEELAKQNELLAKQQDIVDQTYKAGYQKILGIIDQAKTPLQKLQDQQKELNSLTWATGSEYEANRQKALGIINAKIDEIKKTEDAAKAEAEQAAQLDKVWQKTAHNRDAAEEWMNAIGGVNSSIASLLKTSTDLARLHEADAKVTQRNLDYEAKKLHELKNKMSGYSTEFTGIFEAIGKSAVMAAQGTTDAWAGVGEAVKQAIVKILEGLAEQFAIQAAGGYAQALMGDVAALPGAIAYTAAAAAAATGAGVVSALGSGGIVTQPTMALIGERGPEAVIPLSQTGTIGGTTIIQNINGNVLTERQLYENAYRFGRMKGRGY